MNKLKTIFSILFIALAFAAASAVHAESVAFTYGTGNFANLKRMGTEKLATYKVAMKINGGGIFRGAVIDGINVPLAGKVNVKDYAVWVAKCDNIDAPIYTQSVDLSSFTEKAYNKITLTTPQTVPAEGLYVGVSFTITSIEKSLDQYPLYYEKAGYDEGTFVVNTTGAWEEWGPQYGCWGAQVLFADLTQPNAYAFFGQLVDENPRTVPSQTFSFDIPVYSDGLAEVQNVEYTITIAGDTKTYTADVNIPAGLGKKAMMPITIVGPEALGSYNAEVKITKINGEENACPYSQTLTLDNLDHIMMRRTVVEELTGTTCIYCPRGIVGMSVMREKYQDRFIGIALHQYKNTDPMYLNNYINLGFPGAPNCTVDRRKIMDPYMGSGKYDYIYGDFEEYNAIPIDVDIRTVTAKWSDDTHTMVKVASEVDYLKNGKYSYAYVLTADDVYGTTNAWRQSNGFAEYTAAQQQVDPNDPLSQFCADGEYGQPYFLWHYDDVAISASYNAGKTMGGEIVATAGDKYTADFNIGMPTKETLLNALNYDKIYAVVIIVDEATGYVANAMRVKVEDVTDGIDEVRSDAHPYASDAIFSADGKRVSALQPGLNIVRRADGSVVKLLK